MTDLGRPPPGGGDAGRPPLDVRRDAGRDAGPSGGLDAGPPVDAGLDAGPLTCPTTIVRQPAVYLQPMLDASAFSIVATDDGFSVLTSRRRSDNLTPVLWRFDLDAGRGDEVSLGRLPIGGFIWSTAMTADGDTLWIALTQSLPVTPVAYRHAFLRVEGDPPYESARPWLPRTWRFQQLTPTDEPGEFDAVALSRDDPNRTVIRLTLDEEIVQGPVAIDGEWEPEAERVLAWRVDGQDVTLVSRSLDMDRGALGLETEELSWTRTEGIPGLLSSPFELDRGVWLFGATVFRPEPIEDLVGGLRRVADGESTLVHDKPEAAWARFTPLPNGCGGLALMEESSGDDGDLLLLDGRGEIVDLARGITPTEDLVECTDARLATAPGRVGVVWLCSDEQFQLVFQWFALR